MQLAIPTSKPFSFAQSLAFLERFPPCQGEYLVEDGRLTAAVCIQGKPRAFTLLAPTRDALAIELPDNTPASVHRELVSHAARFVGADDDIAPFYDAARGDRPFAKLLDILHGLHHVRFLSLAEIAVYSVMMQRAPIHLAAALKRKFLAAFGKPLEVRGHTLRAMPELSELAELTPKQIESAIGNSMKAQRIAEVVSGVQAIGEATLRNAPYADARNALLAIRGLGPFSAGAILLRGLGRMDELPWMPRFADLAKRLYGKAVSEDSITGRYGRSIGYWSFYLMTGLPRLRNIR